MTPDEFAEIIVQGDLDKIAAAVAGLDERQRSKFSRITLRIHEEFISGNYGASYVPPSKPTLFALRERLRDQFRPSNSACKLALMAVGSSSQAKFAFQFWAQYLKQLSQEVFLRVITDRRPEWIDRWIEAELSSQRFQLIDWAALWPLIRDGVCQKPACDGYIRWMVHALPYYRWECKKHDTLLPLNTLLLEDFDLLEEDVWKLFEIETRALTSDNWQSALAELSQLGHLDRQRLLDASLKALSSGFINDVLTGYVRFYDRMEPTVEELACRQTVLFGLLANPASHVVTFATEKIGELAGAGRLDGEAYFSAMPSVFQTRSKVQPLAALRIAEQTVKRSPDLLPYAVAGLLEALAHPAADVQKKAIVLLEAWTARMHPDHAAAIRERIEELAPSVRARAEAVADKLSPLSIQESDAPRPIDDIATELAELTAAADQLLPHWRQLAGVDDAISAIGSGGMPAPLKLDLMAVPVLTGAQPIVPIGSVEELIDAVAHAVETVDSADEVERILDGLSRLGGQRPADFQQRSGPLAKRVAESDLEHNTRGMATRGLVPEAMYQLLLLWLCGSQPPPRNELPGCAAIDHFFDGRLRELIQRLVSGHAAPLLAAPTHHGGWIDPCAFVERLATLRRAGVEPPEFDLIQALLRLAPDGRAVALVRASDLTGDVGRLARWALGGNEDPTETDCPRASLWLAAGRARQPRGELRELALLGISESLPDAIAPGRYNWRARATGSDDGRPWYTRELSAVEISEEPSASFSDCHATWPTVALHDRANWGRHPVTYTINGAHGAAITHTEMVRTIFMTAWRIGALAQTWPLCLDPFLALASCEIGRRMDQPSSSLQPNYAYLTPLLEPDRPWCETAALAIWMGLLGKDADARTAALDVLIESISSGRAMPVQMGEILSTLQQGDWLKLNRAVDGLGEVARLSPLHAWFAAETFQTYLSRLQGLPRDVHFVLSLLHELMVDVGMALAPTTRSQLEAIRGTSKTAKSAIALRELKPQPKPSKLRKAALQILEARIATARRWATHCEYATDARR